MAGGRKGRIATAASSTPVDTCFFSTTNSRLNRSRLSQTSRYPSVLRSPISSLGSPLRSKLDRLPNILKCVSKTTFGLKRSTLLHLDAFCRKYINLEAQRSPREQYARKQVTVVAAGFRRSLKTTGITIDELREPFENLYYLIDAIAAVEDRPALMLCSLYEELMLIMERMLVYGEMLSHGMRRVTRWASVMDLVQQKSIELARRAMEFSCIFRGTPRVPKMEFFQINRLLGAGGFGVVFKATFGTCWVTLKFVVSGKTLSKSISSMDRMVASVVNHPCIVRYYSCFQTNYANATCMEYICGLDLNKTRQTVPYFPEDVVILLTAQLGLAVQHLHHKGFLHRDIKPANLMVTSSCQLKLIDFDTAKSCMGKYAPKQLMCFSRRTAVEFGDEQGMGTVAFMAPEILTKRGYGRAVDWWAVGVTAFVFCAGRLPFFRNTGEHITQAIRRADIKWPVNHSAGPNFMLLIAQLLCKNLKDRLCCNSYDDFINHAAFSQINWSALDTGQAALDYPPFTEAALNNTMQPPSPTAEKKFTERFPDGNFKTMDEQSPLYTFSSPGFIRALAMVDAGQVPGPDDLFDRYDVVVVPERPADEYTFKDHMIRIPPKPIDVVDVIRATDTTTTELVVAKCTSGYFVVVAPSPDGRLIKGDLVMELNGVNTNRLKNVEAFVSIAHKSDVMRCRLLRVNPFRLLPALKHRLPELLTKVDVLKAALTPLVNTARSSQDFGIYISTMEQNGTCVALVEDVLPTALIEVEGKVKGDPRKALKQERRGRAMLMGDVIYSVNRQRPSTAEEMEHLFRNRKDPIVVGFAPMSSMRCSYIEKMWKSLEIIGFRRDALLH